MDKKVWEGFAGFVCFLFFVVFVAGLFSTFLSLPEYLVDGVYDPPVLGMYAWLAGVMKSLCVFMGCSCIPCFLMALADDKGLSDAYVVVGFALLVFGIGGYALAQSGWLFA